MNPNVSNVVRRVFAVLALLGLAACGGGGTTAPAQQQGTLRVSVTDAPACGYSNVWITIDRVRVHQSAGAGDNAAGWSEIVLNPAKRVDLLTLTNGVLEGLGQMPLPAGQYQQVRLVLVPNGSGAPANAVTLQSTGATLPLDTPSATQSGLKLNRPFRIEPNRLADLILDFKVCESIVRRGDGSYLLKPVIQVLEAVNVAAIVGNVGLVHGGAVISAQKNGVVERSTVPNAVGEFTLAFLDPAKSPYDIVLTQTGYATSVITGVPATASAVTRVSTSAQPINLAGSVMRTASGTVGPADARDDGVVRALRAVGSVPEVEVGLDNVTFTTGAYELSLPAAAPFLATYSTTLPLSFATVGGAGQYTLRATASGFAAASAAVNLSASNVTQNFTLTP